MPGAKLRRGGIGSMDRRASPLALTSFAWHLTGHDDVSKAEGGRGTRCLKLLLDLC